MSFSSQILTSWRKVFSLLALAGIFLSLCLVSCQEQTNYSLLEGKVFHTVYHIKYDQKTNHASAIDSVFTAFSLSLNPFESKSLLSAINRNEVELVDEHLIKVWSVAKEIAQKSEGSYDPTVSPLINAWGFGFKSGLEHLEAKQIDSLLSFVGYQKIHLFGDTLRKDDPRINIDLSSISKGYCSDLIGSCLEQKGARNYLVEIGGEIAFKGRNPLGETWRIAINKPIEDSTGRVNEWQLILSLDRPKGGLATSGNYRNFKVKDGKKYAHTIDPRKGYPIQTDVLSATILAPSCMLADGLATACMTMPSQAVPSFLSKFEDVEYLLILAGANGQYESLMSEGLEKLIVPVD